MACEREPETECEAVERKLQRRECGMETISTHPRTNSSVDRDDGAHDSISEYKSTDRQSPIEATSNHRGC